MDIWMTSEVSYRNGYIQGYIDAIRMMVSNPEGVVELPHTNDTICVKCGAVMRNGQHLVNAHSAAWCPQCGKK